MPTFDRVVLGGTRCNLLCHIVTLYRDNVRVKSFGFIFVAGGRLGVGMRRRGVLAAAAGSVMAAARRGAEVAGFGERLPFSAAEVAARVGGGDGWCGAADVFCGAAEVSGSGADVACGLDADVDHGVFAVLGDDVPGSAVGPFCQAALFGFAVGDAELAAEFGGDFDDVVFGEAGPMADGEPHLDGGTAVSGGSECGLEFLKVEVEEVAAAAGVSIFTEGHIKIWGRLSLRGTGSCPCGGQVGEQGVELLPDDGAAFFFVAVGVADDLGVGLDGGAVEDGAAGLAHDVLRVLDGGVDVVVGGLDEQGVVDGRAYFDAVLDGADDGEA